MLTQGRWYGHRWGLPPQPNGPTGAGVYAWLGGNETDVDEKWQTLLNSLNGLFCTSMTKAVPELTSSPKFAFKKLNSRTGPTAYLRYSVASKESACTENMTPWKKLLPCKQHGLVTLLNPIKLFESVYFSIGFQLYPVCKNIHCNWLLDLVIYSVSDIPVKTGKLDWSTSELFDRDVIGSCNAATSSKIIVKLDEKNMFLIPKPSEVVNDLSSSFGIYDLQRNRPLTTLTISGVYDDTFKETSMQRSASISVSSFISGTDQQSAFLVSILKNEMDSQEIIYTHQLPWYLMIYYHTIRLSCKHLRSGTQQSPKLYKRLFVNSISRNRPALLELHFDLPSTSECRVELEFEKAFLRIREYPPDANHGMHVPGVIITLLRRGNVSISDQKHSSDAKMSTMYESQFFDGNVILHGNVLLITLPVPDFSMPFNVICFVMTTVSLCFGPIHSFSTKMLIPVNSALPNLPYLKRIFRSFLVVLLVMAAYAQYQEMSLHEIRRNIEHFFKKINSV